MRKTFTIDCELNYEVFTPSTFLLKIEAAHSVEQIVTSEAVTTLPFQTFSRHTDGLGNRTLRFNLQPGAFSIRYQATASVERNAMPERLEDTDIASLPMDILPYVGGSRYVESELIFHDALAWIGAHDRGDRRAERICQWIRDNIRCQIGTSLPHGTARDVLERRTGVCCDYAHVALPRTQHPGALRRRPYPLERSAAGFSCTVRGLARRPVDSVRSSAGERRAHRPDGRGSALKTD